MREGLRPAVLLILGPTGSGKSELAHRVALARSGEVVSADAFAVYRGLDVGTDKPAADRRAEVRYHMLDVADPEEAFSAGRWAAEAKAVVEDIARRERLPIVCGGSGFYIAALAGALPAGEARDERLRAALSGWAASRGPERAHQFLAANDPVSAARIPVTNLKYTLRALEILLTTGAPASAREPEGDRWFRKFRAVRVALRPARAQLHARIEDRVRRMLDSGWDAEVRRLLDRGLSWDSNSFQAIGYREVAQWVLGRSSRKEAEEKIVAATRGLAKRQTTWLAREREVCELTPENALVETLALLDEGRETR